MTLDRSTIPYLTERMKQNGGRMPPELVIPNIATSEGLEAYVEAYRQQKGRWTEADHIALKLRREEFTRASTRLPKRPGQ